MTEKLRAARLMLGLAFRSDPRRAIGVTALTVVGAAMGALTPFWLKLLADGVAAGDLTRVLVASAAAAANAGVVGLSAWTGFNLRTMLIERTSLALDERVIGLTNQLTGLEQFERSEYLDRLNTLREEREHLARTAAALVQSIGLGVQVVTTAVLLAGVHPLLLVLPAFGLPSLWAGAVAARLSQHALDETAERERSSRHFFELATSAAPGKELRVFSLEDELLRRHEETWDAVDRERTSAGLRAALVAAAGWFVFALGYVAAIVFVVVRAVDGDATVGDVFLTVMLAAQINRQVEGAAYMVNFLLKSLALAGRLLWLVDFVEDIQAPRRASAPVPPVLASGIELEDVSFTYPGTDDEVLSHVDITIPAGTTLAIVGDNGAGKTTLVKLLFGFYCPTEGRITVDGVDLADIDPDEWRARTAGGFQDFARFELIAREVVGVGDLQRIEDLDAVQSALARAHAEDVVTSLPQGLDSQLGATFDEGVDLSGGQWQKLALGRAMMRTDPLVLVLDEPTASLDAQTEHDLLSRYAAASRVVGERTGAITILVSHRFSTVRTADLIVVIDDGVVAETGNHRELVARGGLYAKLYDIQAKAYR